jgi:hypothetical protein
MASGERHNNGATRTREMGRVPSWPEPITDRTCQVGGGNLVLVVLNYHWDHGTDVVIPADRAEKCLSGGRVRGGRGGS